MSFELSLELPKDSLEFCYVFYDRSEAHRIFKHVVYLTEDKEAAIEYSRANPELMCLKVNQKDKGCFKC